MAGYRLADPSGTAVYGGLTDRFTREFMRPAYTLECGIGENPLPPSELGSIYGKLRKTLFTLPVIK